MKKQLPKRELSQEIPLRVKNEKGKRYGQLLVVKFAYIVKSNHAVWECVCGCGNTTFVRGGDLGRRTRSCGCLQTKSRTKHSYCKHKLYWVWAAMIQRCKNHVNYGGRGIFVCADWKKPEVFIRWALSNGWKDGLHIDRRNNDGGYTPDNCRFITQGENNLNQRIRKDNTTGFVGVYIGYNGKYFSKITVDKKTTWLGLFLNPIDAAIARNDYITLNNLKHNLNILPETT